jgi:hypothetical protein
VKNRFLVLVAACISFSSCTYHDITPPAEFNIACDTISWAEDILPIMSTSCAVSRCHDGISRLDWRDLQEVKKFTTSIRLKTLDRSMPADTALSQEHIEMIVCWIDKGSPDN